MICKECGHEIMPGMLFCTNCGAKAETTVQEADNDRTVVLWDEESQEPKQDDDKTVVLWDDEPKLPEQDDDKTVVLWDEEPEMPKQDDDKTMVLWDEEPQQPAQLNGEPKICPNCGTKNEGDVAFCVECGAMLSEIKQKPATPPIAPVMQTPPSPVMSNPTATFTPQMGQSSMQQEKPKKEKLQKQPKMPRSEGRKGVNVKLAITIAAVGVVVIIGAVFLLGGLASKSVGNDLVYLKDNEVYLAPEGSFKPQLITDSFYDDEDNAYGGYSPIQYTDDGKYIFYKQDIDGGEFDLYYKKAGSKEEGAKLESGITSYIVHSTDLIVYEKGDKLYLANLKEKQKLASDINGYWLSGDKQYVCWYEYDGDNTLYIQDVKLKKDKIKIKDVSYLVSSSENLKEIYYMSDDTLYMMKNLEEKVKISSDVSSVYMLGEKGNEKLHYFKLEDEKKYTFDELVKNDVKNSSEYGGYEEYALNDLKYQEIYIPEYKVYTYSVSGDKSEEVNTFNGWILNELNNYNYTEKMVLYCNVDMKNIEELKLSDIIENFYYDYSDISIYDAFKYHIMGQSGFSFMTGDKQIPVSGMVEFYEKPGKEYPEYFSINSKTKEIYMSVYSNSEKSGSTYELYALPYAKEDAEWYLVGKDVYGGNVTTSEQGIYYVCDVDKDGEEGTLFLNGIEIGEDVYPYNIIPFEKDVCYIKDINSDHNEGTLYINKNGKETQIAEDVARGYYEVIKDGNIAYLADYSFKKHRGDLFVFNGRKSIAVDTDVTAILK